MIVTYTKHTIVSKWYSVKEVEYCCDDMREAWEEKYIGFGDFEDSVATRYTDALVNIYSCSAYPEGAAWSKMSIGYCPFCQERISLELID